MIIVSECPERDNEKTKEHLRELNIQLFFKQGEDQESIGFPACSGDLNGVS